jgi:hypothetical protein
LLAKKCRPVYKIVKREPRGKDPGPALEALSRGIPNEFNAKKHLSQSGVVGKGRAAWLD